MANKENGLYGPQVFAEGEDKRLESSEFVDHWNALTLKILGELGISVAGKVVLDVGAGPSTKLEDCLIGLGARYIAVDLNAQFVQMRVAPNVVQADATFLPFGSNLANLSVARFLLAHVRNFDKVAAEVLRTSNYYALFFEHDWTTLASPTHPQLFEDLNALFHEFAEVFSIGLDMGNLADRLVAAIGNDAIINEVFRDHREAGNYLSELFFMIGNSIKRIDMLLAKDDVADKSSKMPEEKRTKMELMQATFLGFEIQLKLAGSEIEFIPPDIVVVGATKK